MTVTKIDRSSSSSPSLKSLWEHHRRCLHELQSYNLNPEVCGGIYYVSSGIGVETSQLPLFFQNHKQDPFCHASAFHFSSLKLTVSTKDEVKESGSVVEEGILRLYSYQESRAASQLLEDDGGPFAKQPISKCRLDGSQINSFCDLFFAGWSPSDVNADAFSKLHLYTILSADYDHGKITSIRVFWNQAELLSQMGIWKSIEDMKPAQSLKNFILRLPVQLSSDHSKPHDKAKGTLSTSVSDILYGAKLDEETEKPKIKALSKEIGGQGHPFFDQKEPAVLPTSSTKVNCREIGGQSHDIFGSTWNDDQSGHHPISSTRSAAPWESFNVSTVPSSPSKTLNPNKSSSHFCGSGFKDKEPPKFMSGKKLGPTVNQSHIQVVGSNSSSQSSESSFLTRAVKSHPNALNNQSKINLGH